MLTVKKIFAALFCFVITFSAAEAKPRGAPLASVAITSCNIVTGVATGLDAGTCVSPAATCNGVADDAPVFRAFNAWARTTATNTNGQLLELYIPPGSNCTFQTFFAHFNPVLTGIAKSRLSMYGATISGPNTFDLGPGGGWSTATPGTGGICQAGLDFANGCSARMSTALAGATSVTINTTNYSGSLATLCSRFVQGRWAVITGFDGQGGAGHAYGFPPNPQFFDYVIIGSTAACAATGVIQIDRQLTNTYLDTWPNYNSGGAGEADQGGPATIYALGQFWGGEAEITGGTFNTPDEIISIGKSMTYRDVTFLGTDCSWPSQNLTYTVVNSSQSNCFIEVDKIIGTITYSNTPTRKILFQSGSTKNLVVDGVVFSDGLYGTPKVATITNSTIPELRLGPSIIGTATSATCTNCVITNSMNGSGAQFKGGTLDPGANNFYTVSGGVFSFPKQVFVTGMADNGSGKVRLTVGSTAGWKTGTSPGRSSLFATCSAPSPCGATYATITVVDATHIDLLGYNFADVTWTGAGDLYWDASGSAWAVPGSNVTVVGQWSSELAPMFQVNSVTEIGNIVSIATTLAGGFPTVPLSSGRGDVKVQMPAWTCTNCTGSPQVVGFSNAPAATPIHSYLAQTWTNSTALTAYNLWGKVTSIKINVTQAYTGTTSPLRFDFSEATVIPAGTTTFYLPRINLRQAGLRTITPAGVTCDTGGGPVPGACSGDSALTLPDPATVFANSLSPQKNDGSPTDQPWSMTVEFIMDQGVVP